MVAMAVQGIPAARVSDADFQILMVLSREAVAKMESSWDQEQSQRMRACALLLATSLYGSAATYGYQKKKYGKLIMMLL